MKKIRFGIVGSGLWGQTHAEVYSGHLKGMGVETVDIYQSILEFESGAP